MPTTSWARTSRPSKNYDEAIQLDPKEGTLYHNRGTAHAELGQHQRAICQDQITLLAN